MGLSAIAFPPTFYGGLFGWTSEDAGPEYGGYINFSKDGVQVAGCRKNDDTSGMPDVRRCLPRTERSRDRQRATA
jgi:predicted enzyme related to lactoylglutathione lyase